MRSSFYDISQVTTNSGIFSLPTDLHAKIYISGSDLSDNGQSGAIVNSTLIGPGGPAHIYGYSEVLQYVTVSGSTFNGNTGSGLKVIANDLGLETVNEQIVSISNSQFAYNHADGADFVARQTYGTGPYGDAIQSITIANSDFSHNVGGSGLYALAGAFQEQGRAEQYVTVTNSTFNYNGESGIYLHRVAEHGTDVSGFPCYKIQNPNGGCAFVRQTFDMVGGSANYNGSDGLFINSYAAQYGAIYATSAQRKFSQHYTGYSQPVPTVLLEDAQFNGNGFDGMNSQTRARIGSYSYNYIAVIDSQFNNNKDSGFVGFTYSGEGSSAVSRVLLYTYHTGTTADSNRGSGIAILDFSNNVSHLSDTDNIIGVDASENLGNGLVLSSNTMFATSLQHAYAYASNFSHNLFDGAYLTSYGTGSSQFVQFGAAGKPLGNTIDDNGRFGLHAIVNSGGYQNIAVAAGGNMISGNTNADTKYVNNGGTQNIH